MKKLKLIDIYLAGLVIIGLMGSNVWAEYHHVDDCSVCHYGGQGPADCIASSNLALVRDLIDTPCGDPTQAVFGPFVQDVSPYNGVCQVCHDSVGPCSTNYYRNDGTGVHPVYKPGSMGPTDCNVCHLHVPYGFGHQGAVGTGCDACHGQEGGPGTAFSHTTHTEGTVPRGPAAAMACGDCHDTDNFPNFTDGLGGTTTLAATPACDGCHSQGGALDGAAMAKAEWAEGVYEADGQSLKSGNETWCAGCHDGSGATIGDRTADDIAGDNAVYGYYASGHGKYNVACLDCHDPQYTHIDTYDRTYDADEEMDGPRGYQQGFRLKSVNGMRPFYMPRLYTLPDPPPAPYTSDWMDPNQFALCYACHEEIKIQGTYLNKFSDLQSGNGPRNLHWSDPGLESAGAVGSHLGMGNILWDSDRKSSNTDSASSCPTCHDPHSRLPYQQSAGFELADTRANLGMTRQDMGLVNVREVTRSYGHMASSEWAQWGGDLTCQDACHSPSFGDVDPDDRYTFRLGTRPPAEPAFWTQLNGAGDITSPTFGSGGILLGSATFETYTDIFGEIQTGLKADGIGEGAQLPTGNLNLDDEVYGETIDFWYTPNFDVDSHTGEEYLFHCYYDDDNWIVIQVIDDMLLFQIRSNGANHNLRTEGFSPWNPWTAGTPRNIVCTWGPAHGMHMYVDGPQMVYSQNGGLDDTMGIVRLPETVFYMGNDKDGNYPANGIIDDFKIYGYQYQDFSAGGPTLFSKMGSDGEISNPVVGVGGGSSAVYRDYGYNTQHGYSARFDSTYKGIVSFPTTNLNNESDTIDFWYRPDFDLSANADTTKILFRCYVNTDNYADIKVYNNRFQFRIRVNAVNYRIRTKPIGNGYDDGGKMFYHIVCTWGPQGMRMYINDEEPALNPDVQEGLAYTGSLIPNGMPTYFVIGNSANGASNYCDGDIDELRVYGYQAVPQRPDCWVPAP